MTRRAIAFVCIAVLVTSCTTDRTRRRYLRANAAAFNAAPSHPVIVIPGFGVSRLFDPETGRFVWGTPRTTMRTVWPDDLDLPWDPATLSIGHDRLVPRGFAGSRGPINTAWQLTAALEKFGGYRVERDLYPFDYDWRLSALDNAARLDAFVAGVRRDHGGAQVDVVTHSAGALVALTWLKLGNGGAAVRNLVLLAPPERGVIEAFRVMVRPERFIRRTFAPEVVATWPSVPELLPEEGAVFVDASGNALDLDLWSPATWQRLGVYGAAVHPLFAASLARARSFRERLRAAPLPAGVAVHVIAGDCVPTARRVLVRDDGTYAFYPDELRAGEERLRHAMFEPGDGTIPLSSAASMTRPELFCDGHQGLAADPSVHRAIVRILREK
jgi:pimeloyl-ACP methyl ester carboxylesterase